MATFDRLSPAGFGEVHGGKPAAPMFLASLAPHRFAWLTVTILA
jgi:hypothetical protein